MSPPSLSGIVDLYERMALILVAVLPIWDPCQKHLPNQVPRGCCGRGFLEVVVHFKKRRTVHDGLREQPLVAV